MAFRLEDFKKTTRKSAEGGRVPASVYPHQMRDKKAAARLELAARTFDTLVGKRRGEMDAAVMADFFGDPRLARGVIACLSHFYRYKSPVFSEVVGDAAARRLIQAGQSQPMALRAHTYAYVNAEHGGFLTESEQAGCYAEMASPFGLAAHEWASLLHLDAEENQVLTRPGPPPAIPNLTALYNFHSVDTPLRRATKIVLNGLSLSAVDAADVRALARHLGIQATLSGCGSTVTLTDQEMSSLLPRRPGRLGRCLLALIQAFGGSRLTGYTDAMLGTRLFRLTLNTETLMTLGMAAQGQEDAGKRFPFRRRFEASAALHKDLLKRRAQGLAAGWRIRRLPEAVVTAHGVLLPDFTLTRGDLRVHLVLGDQRPGDWGAPLLTIPLGRKTAEADEVLMQVEALAVNLFAPARNSANERDVPDVPPALRALCDRAAAVGMVHAADAQRALHLLEESPLVEWMRRAADPRVRYLPGIGLCSQELVTAINTLDGGDR